MASLYLASEAQLGRIGRAKFMSARNFQYACAGSGILCSLFFLFGFVASGFIPPIKPYWTPEQTAHHFQTHEKGIQTGAALMLISGMFYLPLTAVISAQM